MAIATLSAEELNSSEKKKGIKQKDFIAKLQLEGVDMNPTSYSKPEGQIRIATDKEVLAIAKVLEIKTDDLFGLVQATD